MNHSSRRGFFVIVANAVVAVIILSVYLKRLKKKYFRTKRKRFAWCKRIDGRGYFAENIKELRYLLDEAYQQMQKGEYRYAIYDAEIVMQESVKIILKYNNGYVSDDLLMNIKTCERRRILGDDKESVRKLYEVYHICKSYNLNINKEKNLNYKKVNFAIMQLKDLLNFVEREIIYS